MSDTVIYESGPVARVILNRPERQNAQSWRLLAEMEDAFNAAVADPGVRIIVLSGAGRSFSAGHDLDSPEQLNDREEQEQGGDRFSRTERYRDVYLDSHLRWRNLSKPTVAMVHGYCIFGGWMIASAMDFIFAADDALFIPVYGDYFTAPWDLGPRKAKEILYENRFLTAQEAMGWGFVNRVYPAADLEEQTLRYASRVAENHPFTTRTVKFAINQTLDLMGFTSSVRALSPEFHNMGRRQPTPREGPQAPREGRFRSQVGRAMQYLREDGGSDPHRPRETGSARERSGPAKA
jgi:enoyl-CoA hydratase